MVVCATLAAILAASTTSPSADQLLSDFVRTVCLEDVDRVVALRHVARPSWGSSASRIERDITFIVDGPTQRHDSIRHNWSISLQGGHAHISAWKTDYADPAFPDHSSAMIWISPDGLVDPERLLGEFGLALRPNGPVRQVPAQVTIISGGQVTPSAPPTGWLQHYRVEGPSLPASVEVVAMRKWGEGHREQLWRLGCHSR